jgi:hypothetical protein
LNGAIESQKPGQGSSIVKRLALVVKQIAGTLRDADKTPRICTKSAEGIDRDLQDRS